MRSVLGEILTWKIRGICRGSVLGELELAVSFGCGVEHEDGAPRRPGGVAQLLYLRRRGNGTPLSLASQQGEDGIGDRPLVDSWNREYWNWACESAHLEPLEARQTLGCRLSAHV